MNSEIKYINAYNEAPFRTDVSYFIKSLKNFVFKNVRTN
jgi:hypothetical protein